MLHNLFVSQRCLLLITNRRCQILKRITIIGGGASGTLLAIQLLRNSGGEPITIDLIEKQKSVGRGVAYSTGSRCHLLNVPAAKMSAFPKEPSHFHDWLVAGGYEYGPTDFVPRAIFGNYLVELLDESAKNFGSFATLNLIDEEVVEITPDISSAYVTLASGDVIPTSRVVLAFGNFLPPHSTVPDLNFISHPKYIHNVWDPQAYQHISETDELLIIGTGLSMVDVALRFFTDGHRGRISAISTRGLLPAVHKLGYEYPGFIGELNGSKRITEIFTCVRRHIDLASSNGSDWRAVIDSLRPHTQELWRGLPTSEKRYFMQHLSRYWNAARHRMAPEAAAAIDEMQQSGRLRILKGRLRNITHDGDKFLVNHVVNGEINYLEPDAIFNCIGSQANFRHVESSLIQSLLRKGAVRCDELSLGLDATPEGVLLDSEGVPSPVLRTLGTALKGVLWESTAIPEIRQQAEALATRLLSED